LTIFQAKQLDHEAYFWRSSKIAARAPPYIQKFSTDRASACTPEGGA
jgi:hypothetical protein